MLAFNQFSIKVGDRNLFHTNSIHLTKGVVALVGRNGTGKSTFLKAIMGLHHDFSGEILINGKLLQTYQSTDLAKEIAIVYSRSSVFGTHTGRDVLMLGRLPYQGVFAKIGDTDRTQINRIIELLNLHKFVDQEFEVLSDGEKQLIMIGRAVVQDTPIILLDEPAAFLDLVNRNQLMKVLRTIAESMNKLILFSTHQIEALPHVCNAVLLIDNNNLRIIEDPTSFIPVIHNCFGMVNNTRNEF